MSLLDTLKADIGAVGSEIESLAALVWSDIKTEAAAVGAVVEADVKAAVPGFVAAVKDYASQVVQSIEANPAFLDAIGSWKFGAACNDVFQAVKNGLPGFENVAVKLGQATIESVVQDSVKGLLATVTTNPTS